MPRPRFTEFSTTPEIRALLSKRNYPAEIWDRYLLANWNQGVGSAKRNAWVLGQLQFEERLITAYEGYTPTTHSRIASYLGDKGIIFGQGALTSEVPYIGGRNLDALCTGISKVVAGAWGKQTIKPIELFAVLTPMDYSELGKYHPQLLAFLGGKINEAVQDPNYRHREIGYFERRDENEYPSWWFPEKGKQGVRLLFEHKT